MSLWKSQKVEQEGSELSVSPVPDPPGSEGVTAGQFSVQGSSVSSVSEGGVESEVGVLTPKQVDARERREARERRAELRAARKAERKAEREAARAHRQVEFTEQQSADDLSVQDYQHYAQPRRVKLMVARVNPLSAMKIGFLAAVALSLAMLVAAVVLWLVLDMLHVFSSLQGFIQAVGATAIVDLMDVLKFSRAIALVAIFGVLQIFILTVLSWLSAVIYNLISRMVGGLHVVLTDD